MQTNDDAITRPDQESRNAVALLESAGMDRASARLAVDTSRAFDRIFGAPESDADVLRCVKCGAVPEKAFAARCDACEAQR